MKLAVLPTGQVRYGIPVATINAKSKRFSLNSNAVAALNQLNGGVEVGHVLLLRDEDDGRSLHIQPCAKGAAEARTLSKQPKGKGRFFDATRILKQLNWEVEETVTFNVSVNEEFKVISIHMDDTIETLSVSNGEE